jgi:hypothetical protein
MSPISPRAAGEVGRLLASAEMLIHGISPSRPEDDHGFDIVSVFGSKILRVQVKTVYLKKPGNTFFSERFSIRRQKKSKRRHGDERRRTYMDGEIDAFVFVSLVTRSFWVVPCSAIDLNKHWMTVRPESQWRNAWHVLK